MRPPEGDSSCARVETTTTVEMNRGIKLTVWTVFLSRVARSSFSSSANRIGRGKFTARFSAARISVLRKAFQNCGWVKNCSK